MTKKIFFILLAALLVLALAFVLWFWFFGRDNKSDVLPNTGALGTGADTGASGTGTDTSGNGQAPIGTDTGAAGTDTTGGTAGGQGTNGGSTDYTVGSSTSYNSSAYLTTASGVTWFSGGAFSTGGGSNGNGFNFSQTPINGVTGGAVTGSPQITTVKGADGKDISLLSSLAVVIGGCLLNYAGEQLIISPSIRAVDAGTNAVGNAVGSILSNIPFIGGFFGSTFTTQNVSDSSTHVNTATETITQCLSRSLGRLAVQQITNSTVDWINSGFNGQPAYVQDFGQFFSNVSDQAAGQYIEGSGLAFLCSPFKLQIKIAIAQSYANSRNSSGSSCTLSGAISNVDNFFKGDFNDGGWGGFLEVTTQPSNNAFGAYMQAQQGLQHYIAYNQQNAQLTISPGGFLSQTQTVCKSAGDCTTKIVTPGSTIEDSLHTAFQGQLDSLQLGDSIDQILGALTNALVTKVLYNGLSGASQTTSSGSSASDKASVLMVSIQTGVTSAQQAASVRQREISDIQTSEQNLATLANCWAMATSSSTATQDRITRGNAGFSDTVAKLTALQAQVAQLNIKITTANTSIAKLQDLQTSLLLASVQSDVTKVQSQYTSLQSSGNPHIYTNADITTATQDRTTLQAQLAVLDQQTSTQLAQCYALGQ